MTSLLHFEDFSAGQTFMLGPLVVTREAIIEFATEFDPQPFHLDEEAGRQSILGGLAASGWHTSAILLRLICDACLSQSAVLGSSGMDEVKWLKPVLADDILNGEFSILTVRRSNSRPGVGILNFSSFLQNESGERKIEMAGMFFMRTRPT